MIINNEYDYEDETITTDNKEVAYNWLRAGVKEIAIIDGMSYEYLGYLDASDLDDEHGYWDKDSDYYDDNEYDV